MVKPTNISGFYSSSARKLHANVPLKIPQANLFHHLCRINVFDVLRKIIFSELHYRQSMSGRLEPVHLVHLQVRNFYFETLPSGVPYLER